MKKLILVLLAMILGNIAYAGDSYKIMPYIGNNEGLQLLPGMNKNFSMNPDKLNEQVINETVVLDNGVYQFCSGVLAKDTKGIVHVYTAGHCCAIYRPEKQADGRLVAKGHVTTFKGLSFDTTVTLDSFGMEYITNDGIDACKMDIVRETAGVAARLKLQVIKTKIAPLGLDRLVRLVSPFPNYDVSQRFQTMLVVGFCFDHPEDLVVTGEFRPGMSGSPVLNGRGELVGFAIAAYVNTRFPVGIISVMEATGFLDDSNIGTNNPVEDDTEDSDDVEVPRGRL